MSKSIEVMYEQPLPKQMQLIDHGDHVEIICSWRGVMAFFFAAFTVFWWFILSKFIPQLPTDFNFDQPMRFLPYLHVGAGIFMMYFTAALWINKTRIIANFSKLEIKHGPLPWFGHIVVDVRDIEQLYVKQVINRNKNGSSTSYQVRAKTHAAKDLKFLSGLQSSEQAVFVEHQLEKRLNIIDRRVRGEF